MGIFDQQKDRDTGYTHLSPSYNSIFDHQALGHRRRDLGHVVPVVLLTHARLAVAADGQTEEFSSR